MNTIVYAKKLTEKDIQHLLFRERLLLVIKSFVSLTQCAVLYKRIFSTLKMGSYANAPSIGRIGMAYFETTSAQDKQQEYFALQPRWTRQLRECLHPYISPIDMIRVNLDDVWSFGSHLAIMDGKKMFAGLVRYFNKKSSAEPHQDSLVRNAPNTDLGARITGQLACNVYLKVPSQGGRARDMGLGCFGTRISPITKSQRRPGV